MGWQDFNLAISGVPKEDADKPGMYPAITGWEKSLSDTFEENIGNLVSRALDNKSCTEKLREIGESMAKVPFFGGGTNIDSIMNGVSSKVDKATSAISQSLEGAFSDKSDFGKMVCDILYKAFKVISTVLDRILKFIVSVLTKIDNLKRKLETSILRFIGDIERCLLSVLNSLLGLLDIDVNSLINLETLITLMEDCECVEDIIKSMFGLIGNDDIDACFENNRRNPRAIINCLTGLLEDILNTGEFLEGVRNILRQVRDSIIKWAGIIKNFVRYLLEYLMKPFRILVRMFFKLITERTNKFPMKLITILITDWNECLWEFGRDRKGKPEMSIVDILETLKKWARCLQTICSTFSDEMKRKIKEYNAQLRIGDRFWFDPNIVDLYMATLKLTKHRKYPLPEEIRKLFSRSPSILTEMDKPDMVANKIAELAEEIGGETQASDVTLGSVEAEESRLGKMPNDEDILIQSANPNVVFERGTELVILRMLDTMSRDFSNTNVHNKYMELRYMLQPYQMSQKLINKIRDLRNIEITSVTEEGEDSELILPSYKIVDDYEEIKANVEKPARNKSDSSEVDVYERWFQESFT